MIEGDAKRVTIHVDEWDRWEHQNLHTAIVEMLRREGCAGATVLKAVEGFGADSLRSGANVMRLSQDATMMVIFVDSAERVDHVMPIIDEMVSGGGGLITVEDVHVRRYAHSDRGASAD